MGYACLMGKKVIFIITVLKWNIEKNDLFACKFGNFQTFSFIL